MENNYNRVEVIDQTGRILVINECSDVELNIQDDGKTLKIFLKRSGFMPHREDCDEIFSYVRDNFDINDTNGLFFDTGVLNPYHVNVFYLGNACFERQPESMEYNEWLGSLSKEEILKFDNHDKAQIIIAKYMLDNKYDELFIEA